MRRAEAGFSLVEGAVIMAVIAALSVLIVQSIRGLASTQLYTRGQAELTTLAERVAQEIARDLGFAVRVHSESPASWELLQYLELDRQRILAGSLLPQAVARDVFAPDDSRQVTTGNVLLLVTSLPHAAVDLSPSETGDDVQRIDRFQFVVYHLTRREDGAVDLARWASVPLADLDDLASIVDPARRELAGQRLARDGVTAAWSPVAAAAEAFAVIDPATGATSAASPTPSPPVRCDVEQAVSQLLADRHAEVAANGVGGRVTVPRFAPADGAFPSGFELQLDAAGTGSLLLVRLVLAKRHGRDVAVTAEVVRLVALRCR